MKSEKTFFSIILFFSIFFVSCHPFIKEFEERQNEKMLHLVTGNSISSNSKQSYSRNAIPTYDKNKLFYYFYAQSDNEKKELKTSANNFTFALENGSWILGCDIYFGENLSSNNFSTQGKILFAGKTSIIISDDSAKSKNIEIQTSIYKGDDSKGSASLPIYTETSRVKSGFAVWKEKTTGATGNQILDFTKKDVSGKNYDIFNFAGNPVLTGTYEVEFKFYSGEISNNNVTGSLVCRTIKIINIANALTTENWSSNQSFVQNGIFSITDSNIKTSEIVYLDPKNGSDLNFGLSPESAIQNLEKALLFLNTSVENPTIYVMNTISIKEDLSSSVFEVPLSQSSLPKVILKRYDGGETSENAFKDSILEIADGGKLNIKGFIFDGNKLSINATSPLVKISSDGTLIMNECILQNNKNSTSAGGIYNSGTLEMINTSVKNNEAKSYGGIFVENTLYMEGGEISGNIANENTGGGLTSTGNDGKVFLKNVSITGNEASLSNGGGIALISGKYLCLESCIIKDNSAKGDGGGIYANGSLSLFGEMEVSSNSTEKFGNDICWANCTSSKPIRIGTTGTTEFSLGGKNVTPEIFNPSTSIKLVPASSENENSGSYKNTTQLIAVSTKETTSSVSNFVDFFEIEDDDTSDSYTWYLDSEGKLQRTGNSLEIINSWKTLSQKIESLPENGEFELSYYIQNISDFDNNTISITSDSTNDKVSIIPTENLAITVDNSTIKEISKPFFRIVNVSTIIGNNLYTITFGDDSIISNSSNFISFASDCNASFENCTFKNLKGYYALENLGILSLKNCNFANIESNSLYDAIIYSTSGTTTLNSCKFENCKGYNIYLKDDAKLILEGNLFDTSIYLENCTENLITLSSKLLKENSANVEITLYNYTNGTKIFNSSEGNSISETIRNYFTVKDDNGNSYNINEDGTLSLKTDNSSEYAGEITSSFADFISSNGGVDSLPTNVTDFNGNTYSISSYDELKSLRIWSNTVILKDMTFVLLSDIDISSEEWTPIGLNKNFNAIFDGNGHRVYGMKITSNKDYSAFIGKGASTTIKNLIVEGQVNGGQYSAGIIGNLSGSKSSVQNCVSKVDVTGSKNIAGIVGSLSSAFVVNCINTNTIRATDTYNSNSGGIVGYNDGNVYNCANLASVIGYVYVGGICGGTQNSGVVTNVYSSGYVTCSADSTTNAGYIDGKGSGTFSCCYYLDNFNLEKPLGVAGNPSDAMVCKGTEDFKEKMSIYLETTSSIKINDIDVPLKEWNLMYNGNIVCIDCGDGTYSLE